MRNSLIALILLFTLSNCSDDDTNHNPLTGTWQHTEEYVISGVHGEFLPVTESYNYTFNANGSFNSTRFSDCQTGTYFIQNSKIYLHYDCNEFPLSHFVNNGYIIEKFVIENNKLIIIPTYLSCDEGCGSIFEKQ